ncbi:hypothetical protein KRP22_012213 [Phytophthora ramorum]|nr:hypothetical protein KRP22_14917 [Phytophthora ramorum]
MWLCLVELWVGDWAYYSSLFYLVCSLQVDGENGRIRTTREVLKWWNTSRRSHPTGIMSGDQQSPRIRARLSMTLNRALGFPFLPRTIRGQTLDQTEAYGHSSNVMVEHRRLQLNLRSTTAIRDETLQLAPRGTQFLDRQCSRCLTRKTSAPLGPMSLLRRRMRKLYAVALSYLSVLRESGAWGLRTRCEY